MADTVPDPKDARIAELETALRQALQRAAAFEAATARAYKSLAATVGRRERPDGRTEDER